MKKNAFIAVLALITIALVANLIGGWFTLSKNDRIAKESENRRDTIYLPKWINPKDSTTHGTFKQEEGEVVKNYITKNYMTYVSDTLAPALNIAQEKIDELTRAKFTLEGQLKATRTELDVNKKARVFYENKYLQIVSNVQDSTVDYKYNAVVDVVKYNDKKWLFGKENTYIDISSPDKNMKINGVEHFKKRIDMKPKKWGIGIQAGYYYIPASNQFYPGFGIGVSYNLIRL
ncbi:hypothetical protein CEY12_06185 [Chryseobacterium sp. T16E-39]|uniref:DUF6808 domain-containing protein n=1 Tax=Chryseobacterium sp. T16E-39 TaxID=2015076 RepID=UPI000B5B2162|nr:hypothetical protein [Chryseobacterium sp. T16E-39]ASK29717.1 hypothetical protein CEY12_06185 [Chryseobacterium sp. T16E-39]